MWPQPPGLVYPIFPVLCYHVRGFLMGLKVVVHDAIMGHSLSVHSALQQVPVTTLSADKAFCKHFHISDGRCIVLGLSTVLLCCIALLGCVHWIVLRPPRSWVPVRYLLDTSFPWA
ncbi:hypothetical protein BGY98DRAFT_75109 [Russula aff. rugulosa BPL654]|nr:hypothetical protein BGY98DRAFT_75109 [Russula aff. rugulosa BPL654]